VATVVDRPPVCLDMDVNIASTSRIDENEYFQVMNIVIILFFFKYIIFIMRPPDSDIVDVLTTILCIIIILMQCEWFLSIIFRPQNLPVFRCNGSRISGRLLSPKLPDVRRYMSILTSRKYNISTGQYKGHFKTNILLSILNGKWHELFIFLRHNRFEIIMVILSSHYSQRGYIQLLKIYNEVVIVYLYV